MRLNDLLALNGILPALRSSGKKQALTEIADRAGQISGLSASEIFETLWQRESLGSTGIGEGLAIPHGKLAKAGRLFCVFARLEKPIDFEALDGSPVDLIFAMFAPESAGADHLKALAQIARTMRDESLVSALRATKDAAGIYTLLSDDAARAAA